MIICTDHVVQILIVKQFRGLGSEVRHLQSRDPQAPCKFCKARLRSFMARITIAQVCSF